MNKTSGLSSLNSSAKSDPITAPHPSRLEDTTCTGQHVSAMQPGKHEIRETARVRTQAGFASHLSQMKLGATCHLQALDSQTVANQGCKLGQPPTRSPLIRHHSAEHSVRRVQVSTMLPHLAVLKASQVLFELQHVLAGSIMTPSAKCPYATGSTS